MGIIERTHNAVLTFEYICARSANVVYVGEAEYHEIIRDRLATMPDSDGSQLFFELRIIRVYLDNWLQVAHV